MVIVPVFDELRPRLSVTVSFQVKLTLRCLALSLYTWVAWDPVAVPPSPKTHCHDATVPSESEDLRPSKATWAPDFALVGTVAAAIGGVSERTSVVAGSEETPRLSTTVTAAVYAPVV